jgi:hypothetical protein
MASQETRKNGFAALVVRVAGAWVFAGAVAKLFWGTPKDLPQIVRDLTPFGIDLTFHLVIAVELTIVCLAWLKPRLAWPVLLALFLFFDSILVTQLAQGAKSCGCFGATIKVSPWVMLAVDSALLAGMLLARPWSSIRGWGLPSPLLAAGVAIAFVLPWLVIPSAAPPKEGEAAGRQRYVMMDPGKWVNRAIFEIDELTPWVKAEELPTDGRVVLWRQGCDHCAAHLRQIASEDDGTQPILLVQIRDDLDQSRAVDMMPQGPHVTSVALPENQQFFVETPWDVRVAGGVVTAALDRQAVEAEHPKSGG